jgi:hypothetical protein
MELNDFAAVGLGAFLYRLSLLAADEGMVPTYSERLVRVGDPYPNPLFVWVLCGGSVYGTVGGGYLMARVHQA